MLRHPYPSSRARAGRAALALALIVVAVGALGFFWMRRGQDPGASRYPTLPSIVLITVDTLRADHLSCYGYFRETSPHLDALAAEGVLVERALATTGTTLPSHLSLLTGLYPHQHGFLANFGAIENPYTSSPGRRSVADFLGQAGYRTAAFVSGPTVGSATGLGAGFDHFDAHDPSGARDFAGRARTAEDNTRRALDWLSSADAEQPFFLWVHYWDPHEPNRPAEPEASLFRGDERVGELLDARRVDPEVLQRRFPPIELSRLFAPELTMRISQREEVELPPIDREALIELIDLYDGDVRAVDEQLGRLLAGLRASGAWDSTILAFTSDHGQSLGQHDWLEHGQIQQDNLHVPLVLRFPGDVVPQPQRVRGPVSLIDLMPTVVARLPSPEARAFLRQAEGQDFLSGRFDRPFAFAQRSVRERDWEPGLVFALRTADWTYYHFTELPDRLYRIEEDPLEQHDVAAEHPEVVEELRAQVVELLGRRPWRGGGGGEGESSQRADEFRETLKALGYLGEDEDE